MLATQNFGEIIHQNYEKDEKIPGNEPKEWFSSEPKYEPGSSGLPSFLISS